MCLQIQNGHLTKIQTQVKDLSFKNFKQAGAPSPLNGVVTTRNIRTKHYNKTGVSFFFCGTVKVHQALCLGAKTG